MISFRFLRYPYWYPQWCQDEFLIKALFCLIYCLKLASSISIYWQNFSFAKFFRETAVVESDIFLIFKMPKLSVHNGVRDGFLIKALFCPDILPESGLIYKYLVHKISHLQNFSKKPRWWRVISSRFLICPNWCPQWCRDGFLIKALFCLIYCLKVVSSISI